MVEASHRDGSMKKLSFRKIDAFATDSSAGNPAGYIRMNSQDELSPEEMQRIARELKGFVNEVGFMYRQDEDTLALRYYSSECEVEFCGHATIAVCYDTISGDELLLGKDRIAVVTNMGRLGVENRIGDEDAVYIWSPPPRESEPAIPGQSLAEALGTAPENLDGTRPITLINAGLDTLIVPMSGLEAVLSLRPDQEGLRVFCLEHQIDIITVFTSDVAGQASDVRSRVFAPRFGYLEDPATGSGNAALGYYLLGNGLWKGAPLVVEQNGERERYNIVRLLADRDELGQRRVLFGGRSQVRIIGEYILS